MRRHTARSHSINTRNAALRKLATANRLLIAGSVALTGVLADVAAASFKGSTRHAGAGAKANARRAAQRKHAKTQQHHAPAPTVQAPSQPPSTAEGETAESEAATSAAPETSTAPEETTSEETAPTTSESTSEAPEATAAQEAELAERQREREEAAISGGS